jgi:hypothetical protein
VVPFLAAYLAVFGCRRFSLRGITLVALTGSMFPLLAVAIQCAYAVVSGASPGFLGQRQPASWSYILLSSSRWVFGTLPPPGGSATDASSLIMLVILLAHCGRKVFLHFRGVPQARVAVLAALTVFGMLGGTAVIYRYNPTSEPSLLFVPFVAIAIASLWEDAGNGLTRWVEKRTARLVLACGFVVVALAVFAIRWPGTFEHAATRMGYPGLSDQQFATRWLLEHQVTEPLVLSFSENGVLEFLSEGRIRPLYVNPDPCSRFDESEWARVIEATRDRQVDILVATPYFVEQQVARRCVVGAAADLAAALAASGRSTRRTTLATPGHTWDFALFSVAPAVARDVEAGKDS